MSNFHVHSYYSVRDSIQSIKNIIEYQLSIGKNWFALTDHGVMSGFNEAEELLAEYRKNGVDLNFFPGCEFYLAPYNKNEDGKETIARMSKLEAITKRKTEDYPGQKEEAKAEYDSIISNPLHKTSYFHITVLAYNQVGLENLYNINNNGDYYYKHRVKFEDILKYNEGLIVLTGCPAGVMYTNIREGRFEEAENWLKQLKEVYQDRVYFELMYHDGIEELEREEGETDNSYRERCKAREIEIYKKGIEIAKRNNVKIVGTHDSHYTNREDRRYWEITRLAMIGNSYDLSVGDYSMKPNNRLFEIIYNIPEEELDDAEDEIISRLSSDIKLPRSKYRSTHEDRAELERMVWTGFKNKRIGTEYEEQSLLQIPYELAVIQTKGFDKYFLMCKKIVKAAAERGVLVGPGRGSGAGAEVTFLTDITKCDPLKYGLMFERFLNVGRDALPDVDLDLESLACDNFDPIPEFYEAIEKMFAREQASDEDIKSYWKRYEELSEKVGDNRRKDVFEQSPNATFFNGPIWEQPENIIVVKDR